MTNVLKDFYLQNATVLVKRLCDALPDDYLGLKSYVAEVHKEMTGKIGDPHYTRKMGLLDTARCLNKSHQELFLNVLDRNAEMFQMKEPFDREIRTKMMENRKLLSGMDKHKQLGALPKQKYDDVCLYTTNVKARPANLDVKPKTKVEKEKAKKPPKKKTKKEKADKKEKHVDKKKASKVTPPTQVKKKSSTVKKQDLISLVDTIMVSRPDQSSFVKKMFFLKKLKHYFRLLMSKNEKEIKRFFKNRQVTVDNVISCAKILYEYQNFKVQNILSSSYLIKIVNEVLKTVNASSTIKKAVHNNLFDTLMSYRIKSNATVAHAPVVDPVKLREAIKNLLRVRKNKKGKTFSLVKIVRNRISALHALFCSISARRWMDISRIRWEGIKFCPANDRMKVKFSLPGSKSNPNGKRNEGITLVQDFSDLCPVKLLIEYWILMGRVTHGFVFPCIHKNTVYTTDCVEQWESFRCKGHKSGAKRRPCLGQVDGNQTWNIYKRAAKQAGCKVLPKRHTFRRLGCIIAHKFNLSRDQITTTFGWKFDSVMPNHYLQDELSIDDNGYATRLAKSIEKDQSFSFLKDVVLE